MRDSPRPHGEEKDIIIAGCHVRLTFGRVGDCGWTVDATIRCGADDQAREESLVTPVFDSREAAEQDALERVTARLGTNTDRSHSRVRNWA